MSMNPEINQAIHLNDAIQGGFMCKYNATAVHTGTTKLLRIFKQTNPS